MSGSMYCGQGQGSAAEASLVSVWTQLGDSVAASMPITVIMWRQMVKNMCFARLVRHAVVLIHQGLTHVTNRSKRLTIEMLLPHESSSLAQASYCVKNPNTGDRQCTMQVALHQSC